MSEREREKEVRKGEGPCAVVSFVSLFHFPASAKETPKRRSQKTKEMLEKFIHSKQPIFP